MSQLFQHFRNNQYYKIITEALYAADGQEELVVYKSIKTGQVWVRDRDEFYGLVCGKLRFAPVRNTFDGQYLELVNHILLNGRDKPDRTKVGTRSITGYTFDIDVSESYPLLTIKKTNYQTIIRELIWFLRGSTNSANSKVKIWCANSDANFLKNRGLAYQEGYIGPSYGYQWRGQTHIPGEMQWNDFTKTYDTNLNPGFDQIQYIIDEIKNSPESRRILMSNWDAKNIHRMALPPCHVLFQIVVRNEFLDGIMYQRSADLFLGVPFNVASYSALLYVLAKITDKKPGRLIIHFGDVHIYLNHLDQARMLNDRKIYESPKLAIKNIENINSITENHFELSGYESGDFIPADMAV